MSEDECARFLASMGYLETEVIPKPQPNTTGPWTVNLQPPARFDRLQADRDDAKL